MIIKIIIPFRNEAFKIEFLTKIIDAAKNLEFDIIGVIANIVGIAAVILFVLSYQQKTRKGIVLCNSISRALYVLQYILLGAFEGAILDIVGILASVLAQNRDKSFIKKHLKTIIISVNLLIIVIGILLYENIFSLFPMFGVLLHTGAFWLTNEKHIRKISFLGSPFWFVYNLLSRAYGSCIGDMMTMVSIAVAMIRYDFRKKKFKNVMIFGDSYSTYKGHIPEGYIPYYTGKRPSEPDLSDVEKTWWKRIIKSTNSNLIQNNSWSGSTIGYTGYDNYDCSKTSSFISRFEKLLNEGFFEQNKIDTVFVFGGTNDSWCNAPLGELKFDNIEREDLYSVLPAISYFGKILKENLPKARIIFIGNCNIKAEVTSAMESVCKHYKFDFVELNDIDKISGHPTELGMEQICDQLLKKLF